MNQIKTIAYQKEIPMELVEQRGAEIAERLGVSARKGQLVAVLTINVQGPVDKCGRPEPYLLQVDQNAFRSHRLYTRRREQTKVGAR